MKRFKSTRMIAAPVERVFDTIAHIDKFQEALPAIVSVEFLSDQTEGVGTRFRETRMVRRREVTTELEVTEYVAPEQVRLVSDAGGTIWDTVFTVTAAGPDAHLEMVMDAVPHTMMARIATPLIAPMVAKAVENDLDAVKAYCER